MTSPPNGIAVTTNRVEVTGIALDPQPNSSGIREVLIGRENQPGFGVIGREKWRMPVVLKKWLEQIIDQGPGFLWECIQTAKALH